jgi:high-affinity iron transporter
MYTAFMITLREGIEAFLIVAITLTYLRKTGRGYLAPAVHWGVLIAFGMSYFASLLFAQANNKPLWEGVLALVTAVLVASFTVHVLRTAKVLKAQIESRLEGAASRNGHGAFLGVLGFTVLMITREGMEAALLLSNSFIQSDSRNFFVGAVLGWPRRCRYSRHAVGALRSSRQSRAAPANDCDFPHVVRCATCDLRTA